MPNKQKLRAPRLQLRWERATQSDEWDWFCHYELVLPLRKHDIRREVYNEDGDVTHEIDELVVPIKRPSGRGSSIAPCSDRDGRRFYDAPYRDGAHAEWDSKALGGLPVFCISPLNEVFKKPEENLYRSTEMITNDHST